MRKNFSIDRSLFKILYYRYRGSFLPGIVIIISIILFFNVIIPQVQRYFAMQEEEQVTRGRIGLLSNNLNILLAQNNDTLESQSQTVFSALPIEKDFVGILYAIADVSINAGVSISDYSFSVGDLSTKSAQLSNNPSIAIKLTVNGGIEATKSFVKEIASKLPLSEITDVSLTGNSSSLNILFYYRAFPYIQFNHDIALNPPTKKEEELIKTLSKWQVNKNISEFSEPSSSTPSAF